MPLEPAGSAGTEGHGARALRRRKCQHAHRTLHARARKSLSLQLRHDALALDAGGLASEVNDGGAQIGDMQCQRLPSSAPTCARMKTTSAS